MGKAEYPDKNTRKICWDARDVYWNCLDKNNNEDNKCADQFELFKKSCPNTWVTHFIRKREYIKYKENLYKDDPFEKLQKFKQKLQDESKKDE